MNETPSLFPEESEKPSRLPIPEGPLSNSGVGNFDPNARRVGDVYSDYGGGQNANLTGELQKKPTEDNFQPLTVGKFSKALGRPIYSDSDIRLDLEQRRANSFLNTRQQHPITSEADKAGLADARSAIEQIRNRRTD